MAYIYTITNSINGKQYVGQTSFSLEQRWRWHLSDLRKDSEAHRPLYSAMREYGVEHFVMSILEECSEDVANAREIFWINHLSTDITGYNLTKGGGGKKFFDYDLIFQMLKDGVPTINIAQKVGCSVYLVRDIAKANSYDRTQFIGANFIGLSKPVSMLSNGNKVAFKSAAEAARYIAEEKGIKVTGGIRGHILECCRGIRKTAYGYEWQYA